MAIDTESAKTAARRIRTAHHVVMLPGNRISKEYRRVPGGRILVVDDDRMVRDTVGRFLENEGYDVDYSPHGVDALEKVVDRPPDAILLDIMMPGMNGREFMDALREELELTHIPVLVMTAIHGITTNQALALGASDVVEKPFDMDVVLNKLALALFRSRSGAVEDEPRVESDQFLRLSRAGGVVLIVDPDRATWHRLERLLDAHGFQAVTLAQVNEDMLRLARVLQPQAILLDLHAPGSDGLTTLRRLRREPALDSVPILVVTQDTGAMEEARDEVESLAAQILPKPIEDQALLAFITAPPRTAWRRAGMI
jgi:DNA-binding response OmpR family regulator